MPTQIRPNPPKTATVQLNIKAEPSLVARADDLARRLPHAKPDLRAGIVTRATCLRLALQRGFDELERECVAAEQAQPAAGRKRARKAVSP